MLLSPAVVLPPSSCVRVLPLTSTMVRLAGLRPSTLPATRLLIERAWALSRRLPGLSFRITDAVVSFCCEANRLC